MTLTPDDPHDLARFVAAQAGTYEQALAELKAGRKRGHWIWFVLPQFAGLGTSAMSARYAIGSLDEARAYLAHPVLGPRLRECVSTICAHAGRSADAMLGDIDAMKFRSSLTLFAAASDQDPLFTGALARFFDGRADARTLSLLERNGR